MRTPSSQRGSARISSSPTVVVQATTAGLLAGQAQAQSVKIVGIGAATCRDFLGEIQGRPDVEKNFFAWAQGYMSGLLIRAPAGKTKDSTLRRRRSRCSSRLSFCAVIVQRTPVRTTPMP